jgi:hypothetical protein
MSLAITREASVQQLLGKHLHSVWASRGDVGDAIRRQSGKLIAKKDHPERAFDGQV